MKRSSDDGEEEGIEEPDGKRLRLEIAEGEDGQQIIHQVEEIQVCTVQPHYNTPHYSAVFNITRPCHGSEIDYFAICLL